MGSCSLTWRRLLCACAFFSCTAIGALPPDTAHAQSEDTRVFWQIQYDGQLSESRRSEVQSTILQTLSRAKERHFASDKIVEQKIKKEGVNFPECFEEGMPCNMGGAFLLDVHNVDAYVKAFFSFDNKTWTIDLTLYRSLSSAPSHIRQSGASLSDLLQKMAGTLFEMEAGVEMTSNVANVEVYINQKLVGTTPLSIKTPVGSQTITFKKAGYVTQTWEFNAEKGQLYSKQVELEPEVTQLTVLTTAPDAVVFLDDQEWGKSNETNDVLPGDHKIEVRSPSHHTFSQDYKVYPGTPQTIQVAPLPQSESHWDIRHRGILKYRFSTTLGYHLGVQKMNLPRAKRDGMSPVFSDNVAFHGVSWALNYEAEYWGITAFRLDIGGSGTDMKFHFDDDLMHRADNALHVGFYPAQLKGHYTFWVMQAEAVFGVGVSHIKLNAHDPLDEKYSLSQTAFSIDFSVGLKYFMSEESFVMLDYDLQYDAVSRSKPRNGLTVALGMQIPLWMRSAEAPNPEDDSLELQEDAPAAEDAPVVEESQNQEQ